MTKAEKQYVEELEIRCSMLLTPKIKPDIIPTDADVIINGYYHSPYSKKVSKACSISLFHGIDQWDKTNQRGALPLYSSRLLALRALRAELSWNMATELYYIDKRIIEEEKDFEV